eukprot:2945468-Lingulodinium_polyedra.AAC.1
MQWNLSGICSGGVSGTPDRHRTGPRQVPDVFQTDRPRTGFGQGPDRFAFVWGPSLRGARRESVWSPSGVPD